MMFGYWNKVLARAYSPDSRHLVCVFDSSHHIIYSLILVNRIVKWNISIRRTAWMSKIDISMQRSAVSRNQSQYRRGSLKILINRIKTSMCTARWPLRHAVLPDTQISQKRNISADDHFGFGLTWIDLRLTKIRPMSRKDFHVFVPSDLDL